jgi:Xaa-Pro aminopeptidase
VTAASVTVALLGILLGWRGPRSPRLTLALGSTCIGLVAGLALVLGSRLSIVGAAAAVGLIAAGAVLVPAFLPRLLLFLWALIVLTGIVQPLFWNPVRTIVGILGLVLAALAAWRRPRRLLAVVCALMGGWLLVQGLGVAPGWVVLTAAALFLLQELHRRRWQEPRPVRRPRGPALVTALGVAAVTAAAVASLPRVAKDLPPAPTSASAPAGLAPLPIAERRARLQQEAPRGGLVWPLPSESILWGEEADPALYPRIERLDARFLGAEVQGLRRLPGTGLGGAFSLHPAIAGLRRFPDPPALARLRAAAQATALAVAEVAPRARDDLPEAELARLIEEAMERRGCHRGSFPPIVASGGSVGTGHGSGNHGKLVNGTLVVVDVGCRVDGYVSDFTRTLPVGGRFPPVLRRAYDGVLSAQRAAEKACRPGVFLGSGRSGTEKSLERIARDELKRTLGRDTMGHGLGHTVGLFVHDVRIGGPLQPGMVVTIEPGAYGSTEGLRVEDTYLVTETGCERLTEGFPADPEQIEAAMQAGSPAR